MGCGVLGAGAGAGGGGAMGGVKGADAAVIHVPLRKRDTLRCVLEVPCAEHASRLPYLTACKR